METLHRSLVTYQEMAKRAVDLEEELEGIQEAIGASDVGTVNVSGTAFPGVCIVIGTTRFIVESKYDRCTFVRDAGEIVTVPLR
jgi:uncharacterized protein (DUF342 family)